MIHGFEGVGLGEYVFMLNATNSHCSGDHSEGINREEALSGSLVELEQKDLALTQSGNMSLFCFSVIYP